MKDLKSALSGVKDTIKSVADTDLASDLAGGLAAVAGASGLGQASQNIVSKAKDLATEVQSKYIESGAKETVEAIGSQISEKLDEISGQAMYQLVQDRLTEQDRFNDLLATKLSEALERILELEKRLADK